MKKTYESRYKIQLSTVYDNEKYFVCYLWFKIL